VSPRPLLALLVLIWAISWPVIKVGVSAVPPIWFACLRYTIATGVLVAFAGARGTLRFPTRSDRRLVLVSGVLQMAAYSALTALALTKLSAGRSSVLAFSTPLWVVPLAVWRRQERVSVRASLGVVVGLVGIVVIALPSTLGGGVRLAPAYVMLLASAAAWAVSIVFVREHRFEASPIALAPWQTLVATIILFLIAAATEGAPPAMGWRGLLALAYVGPVATAFAYWAIVDVGRRLPASTLSVALLATPSLGLLISALTLGERVDVALVVGMVLVGAGIRLATPSRQQQLHADRPHDERRGTAACRN
jgi:drug/metabolite transporter (DMT)-like permease